MKFALVFYHQKMTQFGHLSTSFSSMISLNSKIAVMAHVRQGIDISCKSKQRHDLSDCNEIQPTTT